MKNTKTLIKLAALTALLAVPMVTQGAGIAGTKHDLSGKGYGSTEICIFCHTPHNAKTTQTIPLWNHGETTATFTLYTSGTLNALPGQPTGASKACLSCHDGTVGLDSYGTHTPVPNSITGAALLGTGLGNDHPISFTYDAALVTADPGLKDPATTGLPLFSGKLECASCHNVHDNTVAKFLRVSNAGSALCLKCHSK